MRQESDRRPPHARVVHSAPGRLRVRIDAPRGQGTLHRLEDGLNRIPETQAVRANHTARSVTVTFDPNRVSTGDLLDQLQRLSLLVLDLADPDRWRKFLVDEVVPQAQDPDSLPGLIHRELHEATGGRITLVHVTIGLLLLSVGTQVRGALLQGHGIPWLRVLTYLLAAASIWTRHQERVGVVS